MNILTYLLIALTLFRHAAWEYPVESLLMALLVLLTTRYRLTYSDKQFFDERLGLFMNIVRKTETPLALVRNLLEELASSDISDVTSKEIRRVIGYINHIMDRYSHVTTLDKMKGKEEADFQTAEFELLAYITSVANQCRMYARMRHVQLNIRTNTDYVGCHIHEIAMSAALQCLVEKVIEITPPDGCVDFTVSYLADQWRLQISNSPDFEKDCKSRFRQLYALLMVCCYGNLSLIRRIIRLHGGRMSGYAQGKSVYFEIILPIKCGYSVEDGAGKDCADVEDRFGRDSAGDSGVLAEAELLPDSDDRAHVLLLMDDKELSGYLKQALSYLYRVTVVEDFHLIAGSYSNRNTDAIIIDEAVNGSGGVELCSGIKSDNTLSNVPVILLMKHDDVEGYLAHRDSGADVLMSRLVHIGKLKADLRALIDKRILRCEQFSRFVSESLPGGLARAAAQGEEQARFMEKVNQFLEQHLSEEGYKVETLCAEMGMSRTSFYNMVTGITGKPPKEYMRCFKMNRAKLLLCARQYNVTEIATMLGYYDGKYFGRKFKEYYHVSPTQFVKDVMREV